MNKYYLGVDLGSTTSKAVIINEQDEIIGRGITNTRSNYSVAADIAKDEAIYNARFSILQKNIQKELDFNIEYKKYITDLESVFQYEQFKVRLDRLGEELVKTCNTMFADEEKRKMMLGHLINIRKAFKPVIKHDYLYNNLYKLNNRDWMSLNCRVSIHILMKVWPFLIHRNKKHLFFLFGSLYLLQMVIHLQFHILILIYREIQLNNHIVLLAKYFFELCNTLFFIIVYCKNFF